MPDDEVEDDDDDEETEDDDDGTPNQTGKARSVSRHVVTGWKMPAEVSC